MDIAKIKDEEIGYLVGLWYGDGYLLYDKKSRHYQVEFYFNSERDKATIVFIQSILKKLGLNILLYQDKRAKCLRVRTYSKELYDFLIARKFNKNDDFKQGFLSGFIDSDGHYNKKKSTLAIVNTNLDKLKEAKKYLEDLGINCSLNKKFMSENYKQQPYNLYISVKFISLKPISKKITYHNIAG